MDHRSVGPRRGGYSSSRGRIPEKTRRPGRGGFLRSHEGPRNGARAASTLVRMNEIRGLTRRRVAPAIWRVGPVPWFTEAAGVPRASDGAGPSWWPKRRCGVPPSPCATTLTASGSRVRLSVFEENRRQPRCTGSHPERMRPHHRPLLEKTPLVLRAHFGSSRVREDLPRRVREVGRSGSGSANRLPAPTDTSLVHRLRGR